MITPAMLKPLIQIAWSPNCKQASNDALVKAIYSAVERHVQGGEQALYQICVLAKTCGNFLNSDPGNPFLHALSNYDALEKKYSNVFKKIAADAASEAAVITTMEKNPFND
jgi:hypothetical protein